MSMMVGMLKNLYSHLREYCGPSWMLYIIYTHSTTNVEHTVD